MKLYRAISNKELTEFLKINGLSSKEEVAKGGKYVFLINEKTNWVDSEGMTRFKVKSIAQHQPGYSGIILQISFWKRPSEFSKNPLSTEEGKYYCTRTHVRNVTVEEKYIPRE